MVCGVKVCSVEDDFNAMKRIIDIRSRLICDVLHNYCC